MNLCITKACSIKHNEAVVHLQTGDFIVLPDDRAHKIISAGHARSTVSEDYRSMTAAFGCKEPFGSWDAIKQNHPEAWGQHIKAVLSGDIGTAVRTFNEMQA